jgi:hypothetical protein
MPDIGYEIFTTIILFIGIILTGLSASIDSKLKDKCNNKDLLRANKWIFIIALVSLGLTFGGSICRLSCTCSGAVIFKPRFYLMIVLALGIAIIALGITIETNAKNSCIDVAKQASSVTLLGGILIGLCILGYMFLYYSKTTPSTDESYEKIRAIHSKSKQDTAEEVAQIEADDRKKASIDAARGRTKSTAPAPMMAKRGFWGVPVEE